MGQDIQLNELQDVEPDDIQTMRGAARKLVGLFVNVNHNPRCNV